MDNKQSMVFPEYLKDFRCIGPECPDSCCIGWKVSLDKKTYDLYDNIKTDVEELKAIFDRGVIQKEVNAKQKEKSNNYGFIKMKPGLRCPFLDEEKLCMIQKNIGEEYLSPTCMVYPRIYHKINNVVEYSAVLSCPEVARMALLNPDGVKLVAEEMPMPTKARYSLDKTYDYKNAKSYFLKYFYDIQSLAISLLQCREFTFDDRMKLLGAFVDKTDKVILSGQGELDQICDNFSQMDTLENYCGAFAKMEKKYEPYLHRMRYIICELALREKGLNVFSFAYLHRVIKKVFILPEEGEEDQDKATRLLKESEQYQATGPALWESFMEDYAYIIENFMVSLLYGQVFPWNNQWEIDRKRSVFYSYMLLVTQYSILKMIIVGLLMDGERVDEQYLVTFLSKAYRALVHNKVRDILVQFLEDNENANLAGAMLLLNN